MLSRNPNAIHILEQNLDMVDWQQLCCNPNAIHLLENNLDIYSWQGLSFNPNAIHLLEQNLDYVNWIGLSKNPNAIHLLAKLDIEKMRLNCESFAKELASYVFHPLRLERMSSEFQVDMDEYNNLL
jgi:hypothetical protein